jgi:hypothetical protein
MALICPDCKEEMVVYTINNKQIDYCENGCRGLWFDQGELKSVCNNIKTEFSGEYREKTEAEVKAEGIRNCPRCKKPMDKVNKPEDTKIYIDICKKCRGFWLDHGELEALSAYFQKNRDKAIPATFAASSGFLAMEFCLDAVCDLVGGVFDLV